MKAAEELAPLNCKVDWINAGAQHTTDVFSKAVEAAMAEGYDAIATVAGDSGLVPYINKAVDAGIPVATFNSETATANKRLFFVGADLYQQGLTAGKNMVQVLGGKGKVAVITGFFSVEAHELRRKGFEDEIAKEAPGITIVGRVENKDKADTAYSQAQDFMTANPDLDAIYVTAGGPFGAAKAVEDAGKAGQVKIICYDFVDETMQFVKSGRHHREPSGRIRLPRAMTRRSACTTTSSAASCLPAGRLLTTGGLRDQGQHLPVLQSRRQSPGGPSAAAGCPPRDSNGWTHGMQRSGAGTSERAGPVEKLRRPRALARGELWRCAAGRCTPWSGENGAGKSTLMKILGGIITRDAAARSWTGMSPSTSLSPREAIAAGIAVIHQELSVLPTHERHGEPLHGPHAHDARTAILWRRSRRTAAPRLPRWAWTSTRAPS